MKLLNTAPNKAYIAFGANLPFLESTPEHTIIAAVNTLKGRGVVVLGFSRLWQSPSWPDPNEPSYVNAVAEITTRLPPFPLLNALRTVERRFGRQRDIRNAPRTLDIDVISYERLNLRTKHLILPHPRMAQRAFVLLPLKDVAPHWRHPETGQSLTYLIDALPYKDKSKVLPL